MPRFALACGFALLTFLASPVSAQMTTERVASGLNDPVYVTAPAGDTERLFIVEQPGRIKILKGGTVLARPFLDITSRVNNQFNEQGLLGLAFHPAYDTNGFFYVYYIGSSGAGISRIRRFSVSADPDSAVESSIFTIMNVTQPFTNHNGGHIEFGPDGLMYVGLGDGGSGNDPLNNGQNPLTLLAKMLRIDVDGDDFPGDASRNYAIPADNPYVGNAGVLDEIWALGMRNPYRWSFDAANGDLYIADVGQECWEEIDYQPAASSGGENYGWKITEGTHCFNNPFNCNEPDTCSAGLVDPIREYNHGTDGFSCSVTGGYVYRGSAIPNMQGHYFYADFCSDQIYTFRYDGSVQELRNRTAELDPPGGLSIQSISGFGEDGLGELYIVELSASNGEVFKIIPDPTASDVTAPIGAPTALTLSAAGPNPFTEATHFDLSLARRTDVEVSVFTAAGRLVRHLHQGPADEGTLPVSWNGRDARGTALPSGVYFIRAEADGIVSTRRVTLLR
jgi:glucose/arabinose dehydrogenase